MTERILCAAIWLYIPARIAPNGCKNIPEGMIISGHNHAQCIGIISFFGHDAKGQEQGFLTNTNRFVRRDEAAKIAFQAGQIATPIHELYSENINYAP